MKRYRSAEIPAENIDKWGKTFVRVYELQGPAAFEKYQYSIANMLCLRANQKLGEKLLEYVKDISEPKDVLLDVLTAIMLDDLMNINSRILAVAALRELVPKISPYARYTRESVVRAMKDSINSPQTPVLHEAVANALKSINREMQTNTLRLVLPSNVTKEINT